MDLYRHHDGLPAAARGAAVAIGNFDGLHPGHRAVIEAAGRAAAARGAPLGVVTFEPHPRRLFKPDDPPFRLTLLRSKARILAEMGVDKLYALHFDRRFAARTAWNFIDEVLVGGLGVVHVAVGHDFTFGTDRGGDVATLRTAEAQGRFGLSVVAPVAAPDGGRYASSEIRARLRAGEVTAANRRLRRPWEMAGRVIPGDQRGRTLGFPTANLELGDLLRPAYGVYAVRAAIEEEGGDGPVWRDGVASIGLRPTVAQGADDALLEVHLLDFGGDLYGRHLRVRFLAFLRPEWRFESLATMTAQMHEDRDRARRALAEIDIAEAGAVS